MHQVNLLIGIWQIVICSFSSIALFSIWLNLTQENGRKKQDKGLLWLSISVSLWILMGFVYFYKGLTSPTSNGSIDQQVMEKLEKISLSILSILNSYFILISLPFFKHKPSWFGLKRFIEADFYRPLIAVFLTLILAITIRDITAAKPRNIDIYLSDIILGLGTIFMLGCVLAYTFIKRNLSIMVVLSIAAMVITFIAQLAKLEEDIIPISWGDPELIHSILSMIFITMLIMLFFALALSWVKEKELLNPEDILENSILLYFMPVKPISEIKDRYLLMINIPSYLQNTLIEFTPAPYALLAKFALKVKSSQKREEGYLYTSRDQFQANQLNRIIEQIVAKFLEEKYDDKNDEHLKYHTLFRKILFEAGGGGYRLKVGQDNINGIENIKEHLLKVIKKIESKKNLKNNNTEDPLSRNK